MKIEIKADKDAILGGPDHIAYIKLELRGDGHAVLQASHRPIGRIPLDEWSGRRCSWSASLPPGLYALPDLAELQALAEQLKPLLARVSAGRSLSWGGSNQDARIVIDRLLHAAQWWDQQRQVWDADDWLFELGYLGAAKDYDLGVYSSEAAYKAALHDGVVLVNVEALLQRIRQALEVEAREHA
jgi:hypothetical protein